MSSNRQASMPCVCVKVTCFDSGPYLDRGEYPNLNVPFSVFPCLHFNNVVNGIKYWSLPGLYCDLMRSTANNYVRQVHFDPSLGFP